MDATTAIALIFLGVLICDRVKNGPSIEIEMDFDTFRRMMSKKKR